jgi:DNA polymerase I
LSNFVSKEFEVSENKITYGKRHTNFDRYVNGDSFIELLGWFITEGSIYESTENEPRGNSVHISQYKSVNEETHKRIQQCVEDCIEHASVSDNAIEICGSLYTEVLKNLCGKSSEQKKIPDIIFEEASKSQKELLLEVLMLGDGDSRKIPKRYSTKSKQLRDDFIRLLWELGYKPTYHYDEGGRHNTGVWRIHYTQDDSGKQSKQSFRMYRNADTEEAQNGVYCVQVKDNHTLVAGRNGKFTNVPNCYGVLGDSATRGKGFRLFDKDLAETITLAGQDTLTETAETFVEYIEDEGYDAELVGGDTDSCMTSITDVGTRDEVISVSQDACKYINEDHYPQWVSDRYNVEPDRNYMEVELESYAPSMFIPSAMDSDDPEKGVKKTYSQWITWDEGTEVDKIKHKGLEVVRSDTAEITQEVQGKVLEWILREDPSNAKDKSYRYLREITEDVREGDIGVSRLAKSQGVSQPLQEYGTDSRRCTPHYRGSKYADKHIDGENIGSGSKPMTVYVDNVEGGYPRRYDTHTAEDGDLVDAIAVEDVENIPQEIEVDIEKHIEKFIQDPLERIFVGMDWDIEEAIGGYRQTGLTQFE